MTIVEVIGVLIIVGAIAAVSASYIPSLTTEEQTGTDTTKSHLRYMQLMAMKTNTICGINFTGSSYTLFRNGSTSDTLLLPGEDTPTDSLPAGKSATEVVAFDPWGIPYTDASATTAHTGGSVGNLSITITQNTGFIQ